MRVLHLFSNHKWTGPAEPCLGLCAQLKSLGIAIDFACSSATSAGRNKVAQRAGELGLGPVPGLRLDKHKHPWHNWRDSRALERMLAKTRYDIIHCHLDNDHEIALAPARAAGAMVVRSSYEGEGFRRTRRHARLLRDTSWIFEPSTIAAENDATKFAFPPRRMRVIPGSVDLARFDAQRPLPDLRARWGAGGEQFLVGIVARMQTHRHYEDLFEAFHTLVQSHPHARLVVIGRGTKQDSVGHEPVQRLGLEDCVIFTGYLDGDDYVGALAALDAAVYLVPGSDGTCRAVRELLAMGVPVAVADRGMLREIVDDGGDGAVFDGTPGALARVLAAWAQDVPLRHRLATNARVHAMERFDPAAQASAVAEVYERLVSEARRG
jgi:glycosyltransferase involved in cell wall biosynthesis